MEITELPVIPMDGITPVMREVSTAVLAENLQVQESQGESMVRMMEASVNPNLGQNIDVRV